MWWAQPVILAGVLCLSFLPGPARGSPCTVVRRENVPPAGGGPIQPDWAVSVVSNPSGFDVRVVDVPGLSSSSFGADTHASSQAQLDAVSVSLVLNSATSTVEVSIDGSLLGSSGNAATASTGEVSMASSDRALGSQAGLAALLSALFLLSCGKHRLSTGVGIAPGISAFFVAIFAILAALAVAEQQQSSALGRRQTAPPNCDDVAVVVYRWTTPIVVVPACSAGNGTAAPVAAPVYKGASTDFSGLGTAWFGSPSISDLDGDGENEVVICNSQCRVYRGTDGSLLASSASLITPTRSVTRSYAAHIVTDLDRDGTTEICHPQGSYVFCYEWNGPASGLSLKTGWPVDTTTAGNAPEVRGLAAANLDGDSFGSIEIVATTTQTATETAGGSQVFVYSADGSVFAPVPNAWPRFNDRAGGDRDFNGCGQKGYGMYGLNVGIGNLDDDATTMEIVTTYDNHQLNAFTHDGVSINSAPYFTNRQSSCLDARMTWGQFIRWADPNVELNHYNLHNGTWPYPGCSAGESCKEWLQFTHSAPSVVDINGDGKNEVVSVPNIEKEIPYKTQSYGVFVVEGNYGAGDRSARRLQGFETLKRGGAPIEVTGYYPPQTAVAPTVVDVTGDGDAEIITTLNDGTVRCYDASGTQLWSHSILASGRNPSNGILFATEVTVADLNRDGSPELLYSTFGSPDSILTVSPGNSRGHLVILSADGTELHTAELPCPGSQCTNGNGNGAPSAPSVGDIDGDGELDIICSRFDGRAVVYRVPGSQTNCLPWATARGGLLRKGQIDTAV